MFLQLESFLPVKGKTSGPLWQNLLSLLHTKFTKASMSGANRFNVFSKQTHLLP
jgi:hypothetical protein